MKRDLIFILTTLILIICLFTGIFIRGIQTKTIIENRSLEGFPIFSIGSFMDTSFQQSMESALSDQLLFGEDAKYFYNKIKNNNLDFVVLGLQGLKNDDYIGAKVTNNEVDTNEVEIDAQIDKTPAIIMEEQTQQTAMVPRNPEYMTFDIALRPRGSDILEIEESGHLVYPKKTVLEGEILRLSKTENYNKIVDNYPELNYFCYYIETYADIDFINGEISHDVVDAFFKDLDPRIKTSALYINSPKEYQQYFYKTDHHWNVEGQLQGYKDVIGLVKGNYEPILDIRILPIGDLKYNGSRSRTLNDFTTKDDFKILKSDLGDFTSYINYEEAPYGRKEDYIAGDYSEATGFNYYGDCNGGDYGIVSFDFEQPDKGNLICYVESFSNPIKTFIASHYNKAYFIDVRHYESTMGNSLDFGDFVTEHEIDDVLFLGSYKFYMTTIFEIND